MRSKKPIELVRPPVGSQGDVRANVVIKAGPVADQVRQMAEEYQMDPAAIIRLLVVDGLKARRGAATGL